MDSMLDTLTNVVGILIIVLVTVQLSSQEAASRIAAAVQQIDPQEVARLEQTAAEAKAAADKAQEQLDQLRAPKRQDPAAEAGQLEAAAARAEAAAKERAAKASALDKEKKARAEAARKTAEEAAHAAAATMAKAEADVQQAEQARLALAAQLEKTEPPPTPPAKEVRLPDPRPAPAGARDVRVLCRENKIWVVDVPALQEQAQKRAAFIVKRKQLDPDGDNYLTDAATFESEFNRQPVRADDFKLTLAVSPPWISLRLERAKDSGETAERAVKPGSELARMLKRYDPTKFYVRFFVWPDGFEPYLIARQFVADEGFAAGWELVTSPDEHRISLGKYALGEKPKEPPKPKPGPPQNVVD